MYIEGLPRVTSDVINSPLPKKQFTKSLLVDLHKSVYNNETPMTNTVVQQKVSVTSSFPTEADAVGKAQHPSLKRIDFQSVQQNVVPLFTVSLFFILLNNRFFTILRNIVHFYSNRIRIENLPKVSSIIFNV